MSACFYNLTGTMAGVDPHEFIALGPAGVPLPLTCIPHVVLADFAGPCWEPEKRTATVNADGVSMIQVGFKCAVVPHVPFPAPPPHPTELALLGATITFSSSKAMIGVSTVSGEGTTLACCIAGFVGLNANCGKAGGPVLNSCTVITSPTAMDFGLAAAKWVLDEQVGNLASKLLPKFACPFVKALAKKLVKDKINDMLKPALEAVEGL